MDDFLLKSRHDILLEAVSDCYRCLYKHSTPSADYDDLVINAKKIKEGFKIDYENYKLSEEVYDEIVNHFIWLYRMDKFESRQFTMTMYLGHGLAFSRTN